MIYILCGLIAALVCLIYLILETHLFNDFDKPRVIKKIIGAFLIGAMVPLIIQGISHV